MDQPHRIPAQTLIAHLRTTSEKIRKLAEGGYERTEIAKLLGIRYQHVRKVLIDAGFTGGLQGDTRRHGSSQSDLPDPSAREGTPAQELLRAGFSNIGEWTRTGDSGIKLIGDPPERPGVYAFVLEGVIAYVGSTVSGLRSRMDQYRHGYEGQRTNRRVKGLIHAAIESGRKVEVLVATPEHRDWNGLPVNTAVGLEAGLIQIIHPPWNKQSSS